MKIARSTPPRQAGLGLIEMMLMAGMVVFLLVASLQVNSNTEKGLVNSDRRIEATAVVSDMLDKLDSQLRSSSMNLHPIRVYDPHCSALFDQQDNDEDGLVDEQDEAFPYASVLDDQVTVQGIWFQRVLDIDDSKVPPEVLYEDASFVTFTHDPGELDDGKDNDGDGLIDEGFLTLWKSSGEHTIARGVTEFGIKRDGNSLKVHLRVERAARGRESTRGFEIQRTVTPRNM